MTTHYIIAAVLVLLLLAVGNSSASMMSMPNSVHMTLLVIAAVLAAAYAGLILSERGGDERDMAHRMIAGRAGYLAGIVVLTLALLAQGFAHAIDPWIPATLGLMVVAKVAARAWAARSR